MDSTPDIPDLTRKLDMRRDKPVFSGTYSAVYKTMIGDQVVAVKVLRCVAKSMITMKRKVERERKIWGGLDHPNIVPLLGYADDSIFFGSYGALISPWYRLGDAAAYLEANNLTLEQRTNLYRNVVDGVCYLHTRDPIIIHGDLKPVNVLIDDQGIGRLCDFGLARIVMGQESSGLTTTSAHFGTDRYTPRELVITPDAKMLSEASDAYSMACVGLVFIFGQLPYAELKDNKFGDISRAVKDKRPPASFPTHDDPAAMPAHADEDEAILWNILEVCWAHDPSARPSALHVRNRLLTEPFQRIIIEQRVAYLMSTMASALAFGTSDSNTNEPLKNMDTDESPEEGRTNHVFYISSAVHPTTQEPLSPALCLHELRVNWKDRSRRFELEEEEFIQHYNEYLQSLADARVRYVQEWLIANTIRFGDKIDIIELRQKFEGMEKELKAAIVLCGTSCSSCGLLCIEPKSHEGRHDCTTNHRCPNSCSYIDLHDGEVPSCDMPAKHAGRHVCKVLTHTCGAPCALKGRDGCKDICSKTTDHTDEAHLCGKEHTCPELCEQEGICEIATEPQKIESTFVGRYTPCQYTQYTQVPRRLPCVMPVASGKLTHEGPHVHSTDPKAFHYCEAQCERCNHYGSRPLGQPAFKPGTADQYNRSLPNQHRCEQSLQHGVKCQMSSAFHRTADHSSLLGDGAGHACGRQPLYPQPYGQTGFYHRMHHDIHDIQYAQTTRQLPGLIHGGSSSHHCNYSSKHVPHPLFFPNRIVHSLHTPVYTGAPLSRSGQSPPFHFMY